MSRRLSVLAAPRHRLRCRIRGHAGFAGVAATAAALVLVPSALAIGVHVRVEGKTQTIFGSTEPTLSVQATAMDALEAASLAGEFYYHVVTASFGRYVDQIGRYPAAGSSGWVFKVDGVSPRVELSIFGPANMLGWSQDRDLAWEPVRPELVCEVAFDRLENDRFRHGVGFVRWRPDKSPKSCTMAQLKAEASVELKNLFA